MSSAVASGADVTPVPKQSVESIVAARLGVDREAFVSTEIDDADLASLLKALQERYGSSIKAVLLYGSYTRGARDSLVDLYVLLDGYPAVLPGWQVLANKILPPNVYQLEAETGVRCKYALMPLRQFARRLDRDFHSYFWARFAQPCQLLYASDGVTAKTLVTALAAGVRRFLRETSVAPGMDAARIAADSKAAFVEGLRLTYGCELRAESQFRAGELVASNAEYFEALGGAWSDEQLAEQLASPDTLLFGSARWPLRSALGKFLSIARLVKAAATFNDGFEYLLWKIERHSGIYIEPTALQRKLPLMFGWPLFWRLYRLGAFK